MADRNFVSLDSSNDMFFRCGDLDPRVQNWTDWSDTLKITNRVQNTRAWGVRIFGGKEDCLDVNNRAKDTNVHFDEWHSGGRYVCTIKGGAERTRVSGKVMRHGSAVDVSIGEWSDQSNDPTRGTVLNLWTSDGSPITVRLCNGDYPTIENPAQQYRVRDFRRVWFIYLWFRRLFG